MGGGWHSGWRATGSGRELVPDSLPCLAYLAGADYPTPHHTHTPTSPCSFCRDGLLLLHKEAQYWPGQTPLALLWKDAASSRYFIETDAAGELVLVLQ